MPTYVYEVIEENGTAGERFEVDQPMSADPLTTHPMNGKPCLLYTSPSPRDGLRARMPSSA